MDHERPWRSCTHRTEDDIPGWRCCRLCNTCWRVKDEAADIVEASKPAQAAQGEK